MAQEEQTCGAGLAEQALLPNVFAELMESVAMILEAHSRALDLTDEGARIEHSAYARLVEHHRSAADQLRATADALSGCRDLPMARHDAEAMASADTVTTFRRFVDIERRLLALLQERLPEDEGMLVAMGDGSP